jgi:UDP-N-acetylmuramoyl-L-alanyl-D-glutamate--2,6-diaminopimelate ligase
MKKMVDDNFTHLVLEATSHGMYQYRTWGITPNFAGLTNISQEHLDYHLTYTEYVKAKMLLLKKAKVVYLNEEISLLQKNL